jgi:hypothetical protein
MTPISATPGTEVQATFEPDFDEPDFDEPDDDEDPELADDPLDPPELDPPESEDEDDPFDEPDEDDDDESPDDEDAPAFSVFLSPDPESDPDLVSEDAELESAPVSDLSLVLPLRESVR